jgi:DNA invertase Pin-like site-specific DNA recombinase
MSEKILEEHLRRGAIVYVRQSTMTQLVHNLESQRRQYALADRARELGFAGVEVIDEDLGRSGSGMVERPGFQRLMTRVCAGEVGAVFSIEASRLARNGRDWHQLVDLCALFGALVIDAEGVYDPRLSNDRLLLGLKGNMSEFELSLFRQRSLEAARSKARRGALRTCLPVGLVWTRNDEIELDADRRVQDAIRSVFEKFAELGSVRQVLLWFRRQKITLPTTTSTEDHDRRTEWRLPIYNSILRILTNPSYAGAYAFGKTENRTHVVEGRARKTRGHRKARDKWMVLIQDHHPGYVSWETFERNQRTIGENAHMKNNMGRKTGRGGKALLAGLLRCRRCGRMLQVTYGGARNPAVRYHCRGAALNHGEDWCIAFGGLRAEQAISKALLDVVQPRAIEAALEAARRSERTHDDERRAISLELEQARYEARLASRRYESVDPDNRLVAVELEARWNGAITRVRELETRADEIGARAAKVSRGVDRETLLALATNLPAVWNGSSDTRLKQRIIATVIHEIVADVDDNANEIVLVVHWAGGRHTEMRVPKVKSGEHGRRTASDAAEIVRRMAARWPDDQIAATLNRLRLRTGAGNNWNAERVYQLRHRLALPPFDASAVPTDVVTLDEAAKRLGVCAAVVRKFITTKLLPGTHAAPAAPWEVPVEALSSEAVLRAAAAARERGRNVSARAADARALSLPGFAGT